MLVSLVVSPPVQTAFFATAAVASLLTNSLLIFLALVTACRQIGSYKILLVAFAACNTVTSISHLVVEPIVHMHSCGFMVISRRGAQWKGTGGWPGNLACYVFMATFYQTFLIIAYHFVYRARIMSNSTLSRLTSTWSRKRWIIVALLCNVANTTIYVGIGGAFFSVNEATRHFATDDIIEIYGLELRNPEIGYISIVYRFIDPSTGVFIAWNIPHLISVAVSGSLFTLTASVIGICIISITRALNNTPSLRSQTKRLQQQLFRALLVQTIVPCFLSYLPFTLGLSLPLTGLNFGTLGNVLFMLTAIFPAIDAVIVIGLVGKFRRSFVLWMRHPFQLPPRSSDAARTATLSNRVTAESRLSSAH